MGNRPLHVNVWNCLKTNVLTDNLMVDKLVVSLIDGGREFQSSGAHTLNDG